MCNFRLSGATSVLNVKLQVALRTFLYVDGRQTNIFGDCFSETILTNLLRSQYHNNNSFSFVVQLWHVYFSKMDFSSNFGWIFFIIFAAQIWTHPILTISIYCSAWLWCITLDWRWYIRRCAWITQHCSQLSCFLSLIKLFKLLICHAHCKTFYFILLECTTLNIVSIYKMFMCFLYRFITLYGYYYVCKKFNFSISIILAIATAVQSPFQCPSDTPGHLSNHLSTPMQPII